MEVSQIYTDGLRFPVGIDDPKPVFHYCVIKSEDDTTPADPANIIFHRAKVTYGRKKIWDSGRIPCRGKLELTYDGPALEPKTRYDVIIAVWDQEDEEFEADRPVPFETGFLGSSWQAEWIMPAEEWPSCQIHRDINIEKDIRSARIYAASTAFYKIECNHQEVSLLKLAPCMSLKETEADTLPANYQTCPATGIIRKGENNLTITLARGKGEKTALLLQIELEYRDGSRETIISDESFTCRKAYFDFGEEMKKCWDLPVKAGQDKYRSEEKYPWQPCRIASDFTELKKREEQLKAPVSDGIRIKEEISARGLMETPAGEMVIDLGQIIIGSFRLAFRGKADQRLALAYAKALDENGDFPVLNEGSDCLICEDGYQVFEPEFACREFRYVLVSGAEDRQLAAAEGLIFI